MEYQIEKSGNLFKITRLELEFTELQHRLQVLEDRIHNLEMVNLDSQDDGR